MATIPLFINRNRDKLYSWAALLAAITIFYNIGEGLISIKFGLEDETIALFGFGLDSFVEVISGIGIWHMIRRIRRENGGQDRFERTALKITGTGFYVLSAGLTVTALINLFVGHKPETTFWGIIVALVSIASMWALIHFKLKVGRRLNSPAIIADAHCTRTCMYLSIVLLVSSIGYEATQIGGFDAIGTILIAGFALKEGREAFVKSAGGSCGCAGSCNPVA